MTKFAITGSHGTGKTTLVKELEVKYKDKLKFVYGITRKIHANKFSISECGSDITQAIVITDHYRRIDIDGNVFYERCALDGFVYTSVLHSQGKVSKNIYDYARNMFNDTIRLYDVLFYLRPEFKIEADGVRTTDPVFTKLVEDEFENVILNNNLKVEYITGSVVNRMNQISCIIDERIYK